MEISNSITGYQINLERIKNTLLESLRAGQIVQATALTSTQSKQVELRIGSLDILAHTQARIAAGDSLTLQVIKASNPLQMKVLQEISPRHIEAEAMRSALPQQAPISNLMKRLNTLSATQPMSQSGGVNQQRNSVSPSPLPIATGQESGDRKPVKTPVQVTGAPQAVLPTGTAGVRAQSILNHLLQGPDGVRLSQAIDRTIAFQVAPDEKLSGENVRLAFERSGLLLESVLATGSRPPNDMKRSILELLMQLRPMLAAAQAFPPQVPSPGIERGFEPVGLFTELVSHAEGSLARILFNQLSSLPGDNSNQQIWQFEIPYRHGEKCDSFRVQIERETRQNGAGQTEFLWSVRLDFDLEPIGPVQARLALAGEEISSRFTAEHAETTRRIEQALPQLARAFSRAGFKVGSLSATRGSCDNEPRPRFPLLDEKA